MAEAEEPSSDLEGSCQAALSNEDIVFQLILSVGGDKETLCRMQRVCKTWRRAFTEEAWKRITQRFGQDAKALDNLPPNCPYGPWQAQYMKMGKSSIPLKDRERSSIVWGTTDQYFGWERREGALANPCAILRAVCWLELSTRFLGVTPGSYKIIWHMQVDSDVGRVETLRIDAAATACRDANGNPRTDVHLPEEPPSIGDPDKHAYGPCVVKAPGTLAAENPNAGLVAPGAEDWNSMLFTSRVPHAQLLRVAEDAPDRWVTIEAGRFTVPEGYTLDIITRMFDLSGWWKRGLAWDAVRLVRVGEEDAPHVQQGPPAVRAAAARITNQVGSDLRQVATRSWRAALRLFGRGE